MTSPALPEVHLLRRPGHPASHHEEKSLQTSRIKGSDLLAEPKAGASTRPSQKRERMALLWDNGPKTQGPAGSLGGWETKPTILIRPVSPRVAERRSSRTLSATPTCCTAKGRHPRCPSAIAPEEK